MTDGTIRILWDDATKQQWTGLLSRVPNSCYMHSWGYGEAIFKHTKMVPHRGVIYKSITPIGVVQAFQRRYPFGVFITTKIIRGPQWVEDLATEEDKVQADMLLLQHFGTVFGASLEIIPELEDSQNNKQLKENLGFKVTKEGLSTNYLDIREDIVLIESHMNQQWLEDLKQAESMNYKVTFSDDFKTIEWMLEKYEEVTKKLVIDCPSADFIRCFITNNEKPSFVAKIIIIEPLLAGALIVTHGQSATYLFGWCSAEGLQKKADHLLLWRCIEKLQKMGIQSLDLGGIDIKHIKSANDATDRLTYKPKILIGRNS
jgi:hypothetical protein